MNSKRTARTMIQRQRGAVFMVMLVFMIMGVAAFLVSSLNSSAVQIKRDAATADVLAQAKDALISYAASVNLTNPYAASPRPGNLPCPDNHTPGTSLEGTPSSPCSGSTNALGRLPWKTLGLPDLRDSSGERLWYAVSSNFKNSPATPCPSPGQPGCLNSDTVGTITVRGSDGTIINDASLNNGVAGIIIAPGEVLRRQDGIQQDRSSTGLNTASNYLDVAFGEDNATFADGSTDGFIEGRIKDVNGNVLLNDQLIVVTRDNIMQAAQKRVAGEVRSCLANYALSNKGRYPWAAPITDLSTPNSDNSGVYFGRIPDNLPNSDSDINGISSDQWSTCNTHIINTPALWWLNWKEIVFYGVANKFKPNNSIAPGFPSACASAGDCLNINSSSSPARFVVIVAGKMLTNPNQTNRYNNSSTESNAFYYLEGGNQNADQSGGYTFTQSSPGVTFNDTVEFQ